MDTDRESSPSKPSPASSPPGKAPPAHIDSSKQYCLILRREVACLDPSGEATGSEESAPVVEHYLWNSDLSLTKIADMASFECDESSRYDYLPPGEETKAKPECAYFWNFVPSDDHRGYYFIESGGSDELISLSYPTRNSIKLEYNKFLPRQLWALHAIDGTKYALESLSSGKEEMVLVRAVVSNGQNPDELVTAMQQIFDHEPQAQQSTAVGSVSKSLKQFDIYKTREGLVPVYQENERKDEAVQESVFLMALPLKKSED